MMEEIKIKYNGGPAFPVSGDQKFASMNGMTLRDWFAGKYLSGVLADPTLNLRTEEVAKLAYRQADAMLKERDK